MKHRTLYLIDGQNAIQGTTSFFQVIVASAVLLLYVIIAPLGRYNVTFGGVFCAVTIVISTLKLRPLGISFLVGLSLLIWPIFVMIISCVDSAELAPDIQQFLASGALWSTSVILITVATVTEKPVLLNNAFPLALIILAVMAVQSIGLSLFHNQIGYSAIIPWVGGNETYLNLKDMASARAIGVYYEPSMCARVMGTLCFIDMLNKGKIFRNVIVLIASALMSQSLGLIVLSASISIMLFGRAIRSLIWLIFGALIFSSLASTFVLERLRNESNSETMSSSYARTIAPFPVLEWVLIEDPLGVPIGSAETLATKTGYTAATGETKVTNGIYEFLFYFGVFGIILLTSFSVFILYIFLAGEVEWAAAMTYLLLSTALSGSFLSIESSLLTYLFIVSARGARERRLRSSTM